jgi:hypothetical protein
MKRIPRAGLALAAILAAMQPASAETPAARARAIVAAFREATGGRAWDRLETCHEQGTHGDGAVAYQTWFSLRRYGMRVESRRGEGPARIVGFNGAASWQTNRAGGVDVRRDEEGLREAVTTAYLSSNGFFFPGRFPASFRYVGEAAHGGRIFDVVEIAPRGGRPIDYWFDRDTHLLSRVVDRGQTPPVTVEAGDYRRAGDIMVPFSLVVIGPDGAVADRGALTALTCRPVDGALFDPPADGRVTFTPPAP